MGKDMIEQIISTVLFLIGVIIGENLASKTFGIPKKEWFLIEIIVFATISAFLVSNTFITSDVLLYPTSLLLGIISMYASRGISTLLGLTGERIEKKLDRKFGLDEVTISIIRELHRKGMDRKEIKDILTRSGFGRRRVNKFLREFFK